MATDEELLASCQADDPDAWNEVYRRYHRLVRSIAGAYGLAQHDADEVVQITFGVFHQSAARLRADSRLAPWLATVARRHTWRLIEVRRREEPTELADGRLVHDDVRVGAQRSADDEWLHAALRRMPSKSRALLEMLFLRDDEPSYTTIANELGISVGSIGPTRARALERLRELLLESPDAAQGVQ